MSNNGPKHWKSSVIIRTCIVLYGYEMSDWPDADMEVIRYRVELCGGWDGPEIKACMAMGLPELATYFEAMGL
jgi:hypothetical protein